MQKYTLKKNHLINGHIRESTLSPLTKLHVKFMSHACGRESKRVPNAYVQRNMCKNAHVALTVKHPAKAAKQNKLKIATARR